MMDDDDERGRSMQTRRQHTHTHTHTHNRESALGLMESQPWRALEPWGSSSIHPIDSEGEGKGKDRGEQGTRVAQCMIQWREGRRGA